MAAMTADFLVNLRLDKILLKVMHQLHLPHHQAYHLRTQS